MVPRHPGCPFGAGDEFLHQKQRQLTFFGFFYRTSSAFWRVTSGVKGTQSWQIAIRLLGGGHSHGHSHLPGVDVDKKFAARGRHLRPAPCLTYGAFLHVLLHRTHRFQPLRSLPLVPPPHTFLLFYLSLTFSLFLILFFFFFPFLFVFFLSPFSASLPSLSLSVFPFSLCYCLLFPPRCHLSTVATIRESR